VYPRGVAVDTAGDVYVADQSNHRIQVFSSTGTLLRKWLTRGAPMAVTVDSSGKVYVSEHHWTEDGYDDHRVRKYSSTGTLIAEIGRDPDYATFTPAGLATDSLRTLYVAELFDEEVRIFSPKGRRVGTLGSSGTGNGQLSSPWGVALDAGGSVYVADTWNCRIQVFARDAPTEAEGGPLRVSGIAAAPTAAREEIVFTVSDSTNVTVEIVNLAGRPVRMIASHQQAAAGLNRVLWNARSNMGTKVPNGTYLVRVTACGAKGGASHGLTTLRLNR